MTYITTITGVCVTCITYEKVSHQSPRSPVESQHPRVCQSVEPDAHQLRHQLAADIPRQRFPSLFKPRFILKSLKYFEIVIIEKSHEDRNKVLVARSNRFGEGRLARSPATWESQTWQRLGSSVPFGAFTWTETSSQGSISPEAEASVSNMKLSNCCEPLSSMQKNKEGRCI